MEAIIIKTVMMLMILFVMRSSIKALYDTVKASRWQATKGEYLIESDDEVGFKWSHEQPGYKYVVNGHEYINDRIGFGIYTQKNSRKVGFSLHNILAFVLVTRTLLKNKLEPTIYYDPEFPEESALTVGMSLYHWYHAFICFVLGVFAAFILHDIGMSLFALVAK